MKKPASGILLVGGGGHCKSVLSAMLGAGLNVSGIIEKDVQKVGAEVLGVPVVGTDADIEEFLKAGDYEFLITVGSVKDNSARTGLYRGIVETGGRLTTFIAGSAIIGMDVSLGAGTVVLERAVVNAGAIVGENCIINTAAIVEHDVVVGDGVHIAPAATIGGGAIIGRLAFIGANSTILQGIKVGPRSVVGAGSAVIKNVPEGVMVAGCPSEVMQKL